MDHENDLTLLAPEPEAGTDLGDVAELTEGVGNSRAEAKRQPYN